MVWDGNNADGVPLASGHYMSECVISRNDSTFKFTEPLFINIEDVSSSRVNAYSSSQGVFNISNIPIDSVFINKDAGDNILDFSKVCDSVTVYAIKNGYSEISTTLTLGRNTTSTINFVLK